MLWCAHSHCAAFVRLYFDRGGMKFPRKVYIVVNWRGAIFLVNYSSLSHLSKSILTALSDLITRFAIKLSVIEHSIPIASNISRCDKHYFLY